MSSAEPFDQFSGIAIIGMAGRFPGAKGIAEFWQNLCEGKESISRLNDEELLDSGVGPDLLRNPNYIKARGVLEMIDCFDAAFFEITPADAAILDPQHRFFLECAWEALENAGYDPGRYKGRIGVYAGASSHTYFLSNLLGNQQVLERAGPLKIHLSNEKDHLSLLTSYKLRLRGPSLTVSTACSTSLVATHLACQALLYGECDMALAGGVSIKVPHKVGYLYQEGGIDSPDGHCRAFDASAKGSVGGSGVGIVVLKSLSAALADNDSIYAVIKGSALNNDGAQKVGYSAPSIEGQAEVIAEAHAMSDIEPETITYVETHGTGTSLGDPIEVEALTRAFHLGTTRKGFCALGSVKTNVGHLDAAAGVTGLIKTALAVKHGLLPPSLHFTRANPLIDFANSPFYVNTQLTEWQTGLPRRAGVSAFGMGGTNAHVVLEEAPLRKREGAETGRPSQLLLISARTNEALRSACTNLGQHLKEHPEIPLADAAYTLQVGRKHFKYRQMFVCRDRDDALHLLLSPDPQQVFTASCGENAPELVFLLPGQGTQFVQMAAELYLVEAYFRELVDHCSELLKPLLGSDLRDLLYPPLGQREEAKLHLLQPAIAQSALFVIEYALARLWMKWGVRPTAMLGHGLGEYVAACLAGVFSLEGALRLVSKRGQMMQDLPQGAMLSISLPEQEVILLLANTSLSLAAVDSPTCCVVSGPTDAIEKLEGVLHPRGIACRTLSVSHAFHSWMMEPMRESFTAQVQDIALQAPSMPFISNVTGQWITNTEATNPSYWGQHMRETVRFAAGVQTLLSERYQVFLEVGPGQTLRTLVGQCSNQVNAAPTVLTSLHEQCSEPAFLLQTLGQLWLAGVHVNWSQFSDQEQRYRVPLPTYPFERKRYWIDPPHKTGFVGQQEKKEKAPQNSSPSRISTQQEEPMQQIDTQYKEIQQRQQVVFTLQGIFGQLLGIKPEEVIPQANFFELGANSLLFLQVSQAIRDTFAIELPYRLLIETYPTIASLAAYVDQQLPQKQPVAAFAQGRVIAHAQPPAAQFFSRNEHDHRQESAPAFPVKQALSFQIDPETFVPYKPQQYAVPKELTPQQQQHLAALIERLTERTQNSKRQMQAFRPFLADSRATTNFSLSLKELIYPISMQRAAGSRVWDVDGNEYVDLCMGYGALLFGHSPSFLMEALSEQISQGIRLGLHTEYVGRAAELICQLTGAERAAFCNSGTEAVMAALRLARTVTGRKKIALFAGAYHGTFDGVLTRTRKDGELHPQALPLAPGTPPGMVEDVLVFPFGKAEALPLLSAQASELAAVLVEIPQSRRPDFLPVEFMRSVRQITRESGTALIFDELITGFRVLPGGSQELLQISADLVTYGKVLAAGLPVAAVAGKARYMDAIDGGAWNYGDDSFPQVGQTLFAGTYFKHPLLMPAVWAVLRHLQQSGSALQEQLNARTTQMAERLNAYFEQEQLPMRVVSFSSLFRFVFPPALKALEVRLFYYHLLEKGIYISEIQNCFISTAHTDEDIERVLEAVKESVALMRAGGFLLPLSSQQDQRKRRSLFPLTEEQREIWFFSQMSVEASRSYHHCITFEISGPLKRTALEQAVQEIVRRHEALRAIFSPDGDVQEIAAMQAVEIPLTALPELERTEQDRRASEWLSRETAKPFDLSQSPLLRGSILQLAEEHHIFLLTLHHIIADGWSIGIIIEEFSKLYMEGCRCQLPIPTPYSEYIAWQTQQLSDPGLEKAQQYWLERLCGPLTPLELPADHPRPALQSYRAEQQHLILNPLLTRKLKHLSMQQNCTFFTTLLVAFKAWLYRLTQQEDLTIAIERAGQPFMGKQRLVGHCVHLLPIRSRVAGDGAFVDYLQQVKGALLDAYSHYYPFMRLIKDLKLPPDPGRMPLTNVLFNLDTPSKRPFADLNVKGFTYPSSSIFDLALNALPIGEELFLDWTYSTDLFEAQTIEHWMRSLEAFLESVVTAADQPLDHLPL